MRRSATQPATTALAAAVAVLASAETLASAPLEIVFTAETGFQPLPCRCNARPLGGWAQRQAVIDSMRAGLHRPLVVDAGGFLDGGISREVAALVAEAHALLGYDAINVGPTELNALGPGDTPAWVDALPLVSGHPARPEGVPAFRIVERDQVRIGIIGAGRFEASAPTPAEQVGRTLSEMGETDAVIVLLAGGLGPFNTIADVHDRVDVVVYGDGARTPNPIRRRAAIGVAPGTRGRYVGLLVLPSRGADVDSCAYALAPVGRDRRGVTPALKLAVRAAELHSDGGVRHEAGAGFAE